MNWVWVNKEFKQIDVSMESLLSFVKVVWVRSILLSKVYVLLLNWDLDFGVGCFRDCNAWVLLCSWIVVLSTATIVKELLCRVVSLWCRWTYWCEDNLLWTSVHWWDHMMNISIAGERVFMKDCWFDGHFAVICELHQRMTFFFWRHVYGINFDWMLFKICFLYCI